MARRQRVVPYRERSFFFPFGLFGFLFLVLSSVVCMLACSCSNNSLVLIMAFFFVRMGGILFWGLVGVYLVFVF